LITPPEKTSDQLLETILNDQATIIRLMNIQQTNMQKFLYSHNKKRENVLSRKMQAFIDAIQGLQESITTSESSKGLNHSAYQPTKALPLSKSASQPARVLNLTRPPDGLGEEHVKEYGSGRGEHVEEKEA
jgi:uncharacterized phage infection (PIP) family protein YhgE